MVTNSKGFTLLELIIIIAILGISMAIAAPGLSTMIANNRISSSASDFASALQLAKAEAVARLNPVIVCKKNAASNGCIADGDWSQGWIVFSDDNGNGGADLGSGESILLVHEALEANITFVGSDGVDSSITFRPSGTNSITSTESLVISDQRGLDNCATRTILVTITGRGSVMKPRDTGQEGC